MSAALSRPFFSPDEWKYIQAVLKYRLDLHFYLSQVHQSTFGDGTSYESIRTNPFLQHSTSNFPSFANQATFLESFGQPTLNVLSPPTTPIKISADSNTFQLNPFETKSDKKLLPLPRDIQKNSREENVTFFENFKSENKERKFQLDLDDRSRESDHSSSTELSKLHEDSDEMSKVDQPSSEFVLTEDRSKRFGCPHSGCDYKSNRKNNLQRHKETMHQARAVAFNCCSIRFYRRADFDRHKATKHREGYACEKCDKHFERRATLARHERSHDKETPFWCPYCYYRNGNESNNRRHIRKHEDFIGQRIDSHWNPYSPQGSIAILKEKVRPLHEIKVLLEKMNSNEIVQSTKSRKLSLSQLPDSTTKN